MCHSGNDAPMLQKAPRVMLTTPVLVSEKESSSPLSMIMLSDPNDEESTYEYELKFYMSGRNVNKVDGSLVGPAWMVPPTDLRYPILSVRESTHSFPFKGKMLQYDMTYLGMPLHDGDDDLDPARSTPVLMKVIKGPTFALLMRSDLPTPKNVLILIS